MSDVQARFEITVTTSGGLQEENPEEALQEFTYALQEAVDEIPVPERVEDIHVVVAGPIEHSHTALSEADARALTEWACAPTTGWGPQFSAALDVARRVGNVASPRSAGPITPDEIADHKRTAFPRVVFAAFNQLLVEKDVGDGEIHIPTKEVVALMVERGLKRDDIFRRGWLNIEAAYERAGWSVTYDKPGYNENYDAFFVFTRKE